MVGRDVLGWQEKNDVCIVTIAKHPSLPEALSFMRPIIIIVIVINLGR